MSSEEKNSVQKRKKKIRILKSIPDNKFESVNGSESESVNQSVNGSESESEITRPSDLQNHSVFDIYQKYPPYSWERLFQKKAFEELKLISTILDNKEKAYGHYIPAKIDIFRAFDLCPIHKVNVVIFGQDPYHQILPDGKPRAQGLAFSVSKDDEIPSSLSNIFKEISEDIGTTDFFHGDLTSWAKQGILLLNTCLTVQPHLPKSHGKFWLSFVKKVIRELAVVNKDCIYVLWGNEAKSLKKFIEGTPPILEAAHPSGLSYSRGFRGCKHFSQINQILHSQNKKSIDWTLTY